MRSSSVETVIARLKHAAAVVPGMELFLHPVQDLTIDGGVSRTQYQFVLQDANGAELADWTPKLLARLASLPQLADVASDLSQTGLSVQLDIDRDRAARFGITPATIDNALYDAFGQRIVSTIFTTSSQQRVILEADPTLKTSLEALSSLYLPSASGTQVPLSVLTTTHVAVSYTHLTLPTNREV